ncbi:2614_t:CDS:2 [Paraglomus occultum]|uniref:2614_t:CDS:1 n=1 Tax=Paraglomus occultum TaxID=144539 RepID=A0A9N8YZT6_9GLOM|nr:2614_t:CDS:2 [Paraglomus occultum]
MFYRLLKFTVVIFTIAFLSELAHTASPPPIEATSGPFLCHGTNATCCPLLAHKIASEHSSRCASIILDNKSGYNVSLVVASLEDGRWVTSDDSGDVDIDCSPRTGRLANGELEVLSSVTSHFLGGIRGYATFRLDDDAFNVFTIYWDAPLIGSNGYGITGLPTTKYHVALQHDLDRTVFQVTIRPVITYPTNWGSIFSVLSLIGIVCFILLCCSACCVQDNSLHEHINSQPQLYHSASYSNNSRPEPSRFSDYFKPSSSNYSTISSNRSKLQQSSDYGSDSLKSQPSSSNYPTICSHCSKAQSPSNNSERQSSSSAYYEPQSSSSNYYKPRSSSSNYYKPQLSASDYSEQQSSSPALSSRPLVAGTGRLPLLRFPFCSGIIRFRQYKVAPC